MTVRIRGFTITTLFVLLVALAVSAMTQAETAKTNKKQVYHLQTGHTLVVKNKTITILSPSKKPFATNTRLIRIMDEHKICPSEGFMHIATKGHYFTVEQGNCGGWFLINEYVTFKWSAADKQFYLHKIGLTYTDRREPVKQPKVYLFDRKRFGKLKFTEVTKELPYQIERRLKPLTLNSVFPH